MSAFQSIYTIVSRIPEGKVMTYKQVARLSGVKNPRVVGSALHKNTDPKAIPCHRVVNAKGEVAKGYAFGGAQKQKEKLEQEGVVFNNPSQVDLQISLMS